MIISPILMDRFARQFYYLRLSITDVCNFRCAYCLPNGYQSLDRTPFLSLTEIDYLARAFNELGTEKIRLTGGEPTLRKDLLAIIERLHHYSTIKYLVMTTNGTQLAKHIKAWHQAGLTGVNVSIDSLDARQFYQITGKDQLANIMKGIDIALSQEGLTVKVNSVLLRKFYTQSPINKHFLAWIKNRPIQIRFIELMATGKGYPFFQAQHYIPDGWLQELIDQGWQLKSRQRSDGPAQIFTHPDYLGEIGFILPYSPNFCSQCNRLRVSARGQLHLCLFGNEGINLRKYLRSSEQLPQLKQLIQSSVAKKQVSHLLHEGNSGNTDNLSQIGG